MKGETLSYCLHSQHWITVNLSVTVCPLIAITLYRNLLQGKLCCIIVPHSCPVSSFPSFLLSFTCGYVCVRTLTCGVELLEKRSEYVKANQLLEKLLSQQTYGRGRRKRWWERLALNYDYHLKNKSKVGNIGMILLLLNALLVYLTIKYMHTPPLRNTKK